MLATTLGVWCGKSRPRFSAQTQEGLCWTEAGIMGSACLYGSSLGLRWVLCWAKSGPCWAMLGSSWAHVGPMLGLCWPMPMLAHVEPSWELCWGHVWAIYVETILRCQLFRPGPPAGAQNHVKTEVLYRRARNTVKKNDVLTPQAKYTVNYRGFSWHVVVRGWVGGRVWTRALITFGCHRRPPSRTPAPWPAPGLVEWSRAANWWYQ